ncbi:hypothetical protein IWT140_01731 [Secundilactobacillus pentosiphilus]|uniref:DUF3310 domain-containing protein n=1 Tax=Secundilactobacillus pentosiphilus TaxID=1714682 RepID=A0A1Z5IQP6_9LACO|nr:DUF3310 domain-containing protein [Secundilactobacillus pentosiphilus]GAX04094.1 hypothetical protein IWT140_01731 [Secundilactobacillus pentosiphilus]
MSKTKPSYYQNNGKDLFARFEDGLMTPEENRGFYKGNVFKYMTRYMGKGGLGDLDKGMVYLNRLEQYEQKLDLEQYEQKSDEQKGIPQSNSVKRAYLVYLEDFNDVEFIEIYPSYEDAESAIDGMVKPKTGTYYIGQVILSKQVIDYVRSNAKN